MYKLILIWMLFDHCLHSDLIAETESVSFEM